MALDSILPLALAVNSDGSLVLMEALHDKLLLLFAGADSLC